MPTYIALLRAVNLGGSTQISMAALSNLLRRRGYERVETLLQSGNVVLRTGLTKTELLERRLKDDVSKGLGFETEFFVRTAAEWGGILASNPFPAEARADPGRLVVTLLKSAPTSIQWKALQESIKGRERIQAAGNHAYIVYPDGQGRSKLTVPLIERKLGARSTSRNWNTVQRLDRLAAV
ncbi:MAG: DUF1697 domain-containing protein [Thermoplasmata archaeon]